MFGKDKTRIFYFLYVYSIKNKYKADQQSLCQGLYDKKIF
jgi:hypothetical protein